jgi:MinD superfamily P-loop ATPase
MLVPEIKAEKCSGCGLCVSVCDKNGLVLMESHVVFIGGDGCTWCGLCEAVCEHEAISCPYEIVLADSSST